MKTNYLIIGAVLFLASCGNKTLKEAERAYGSEQFATAAKLYEVVLTTNSDQKAMLKLADCYRHMNRHDEAEKWYSKSINSPDATAIDKLHYAEVLKEEGKYREAAPMFDAYLLTVPNDQMAKNQRATCNSEDAFEKVNPFYNVERMPILNGVSCFSPTIIGDKLIFTAPAEGKTMQHIDSWTGNGFLDIYASELDGTNASPISGSINSQLHEGSACYSQQGNQIFFTRSLMNKNKAGRAKDNDNHLELCSADLVDGKWTNIQSLSFNNTEYSVGQPAISSDGKRLFFVSDMPGGFGGTDIYYADFTDGSFKNPVNAGAEINTNGNEMFPTVRMVHAGKDEFYFSSDGLEGQGGLDIFKCEVINNSPQIPMRLISPFNSSTDDFGIIFNADGNGGYFSSNRGNTEGKDGIFRFKRHDPKFFVKLNVVEKGTNIPFKLTNIEVKTSQDGKDFNVITDENGCSIFPADSLTAYNFCLRNKNVFACYAGVVTGGFKGTFSDTSYVTLNVEKIVINKPIRLENIYYDYNKWDIRPDAAIELDKLVKILVDNPQIKIELSSHTDSRGSDKYNMTLSQKRAQSAVDYIISKGISRDRITAKGYGESVPLNKCTNGVKCTEEEWQFNRRTEFKVTSLIQQ